MQAKLGGKRANAEERVVVNWWQYPPWSSWSPKVSVDRRTLAVGEEIDLDQEMF